MKKIIIIILFFYVIFFQNIYSQSLYKIFEKGKVGFIDSTGSVIIKPIFDGVCDFSEGLSVARIGSKYGYINEKGDFVITPQFDWAWGFSEGFAVVHNNGKFFYIDTSGKIPFETNFDFLDNFYNGRAFIRTFGNKGGIIDKKGYFIVDTIYDEITPFQFGTSIVYKDDKENHKSEWGLIDSTGNIIVPPGKYSSIINTPYKQNKDYIEIITKFIEGRNPIYGIINNKGKLIYEYDTNTTICPDAFFNDGISPVRILKPDAYYKKYSDHFYDYYIGFMDTTGNILFYDTSLTDSYNISNGIAIARNHNNKYALIKRYPEWKVIYLDVEPLEKECMRGEFISRKVYKDSSVYGILDTLGIFTRFKESFNSIFYDLNGGGTINLLENNRLLYDKEFSNLKYIEIENDYNRPKFGLCNSKGEILSEPIIDYTCSSGFMNGLMRVIINGSRAYMNLDGKVVWKEKINILNPDTLNINFLLNPELKRRSKKSFIIDSPQTFKTDSGYYYKPNSLSVTKMKYPKDKMSFFVDTTILSLYNDKFAGYKVFFINPGKKYSNFNDRNSKLEMMIQILDSSGNWRDIESYNLPKMSMYIDGIDYYSNSPLCGEQHYTEFIIPLFKGDIKTKFRIRLEQIPYDINSINKGLKFYSNEFEGSYNSGQLWKIYEEYHAWQKRQNYYELDYDEDWVFLHHN